MIYVTRRESFSAAHRLFRPDWPAAKNLEVFGMCSNPNWHGHNYTLYVTIKGEIDPETGFLINLKDLSALIRKLVIDRVDHRNLNVEVGFIERKPVSTENLAVAVWEVLEPGINELNASLHCVKLVETENNYVEYFGKVEH